MRNYRHTRTKNVSSLLERIVNKKIRNSVAVENGYVVLAGGRYDAADVLLQVDPIRYLDLIAEAAEHAGISEENIDWDHYQIGGWHTV